MPKSVLPALPVPHLSPSIRRGKTPAHTPLGLSEYLDKYLTGPEHYERVKFQSLALLREKSPATHAYLWLGRSPVAISTFLNGVSGVQGCDLPLSGINFIKHLLPPNEYQGQPWNLDTLETLTKEYAKRRETGEHSPPALEKVFDWFDPWVPDDMKHVKRTEDPNWLRDIVASLLTEVARERREVESLSTDEFLESIFRHFDRCIPDHLKRGRRTLVLVDAARSRITLDVVELLLKEYLKQRKLPLAVDVYAFNIDQYDRPAPFPDSWAVAPRKQGYTLDSAHHMMLTQDAYRLVSKYPRTLWWRLDELELAPRPEHARFAQAMATNQAADPTLALDLAIGGLRKQFEGPRPAYQAVLDETTRLMVADPHLGYNDAVQQALASTSNAKGSLET